MENIGDIWSVTPGDEELFQEWIKKLPASAPMPYGLMAHSVKNLRKAVEVFQPKSILEIGFNIGRSASMWLNLSDATLVSVDIGTQPETLQAAKALEKQFPKRFCFLNCDSRLVYDQLKDTKFDMIFIDGDHTENGVDIDIKLGLKLGIKNFVFDDWMVEYGPGTQPAIAKNKELTVTHVCGGNIALAVAV
jgi:predicted O-methyltransferase YrrM